MTGALECQCTNCRVWSAEWDRKNCSTCGAKMDEGRGRMKDDYISRRGLLDYVRQIGGSPLSEGKSVKNKNTRIRELPLTLLTIVLIILKATGRIELSWVWVLCPVWIPAVIAIACLAFVGIFKSKEMAKNRKDR